MNGTSADKRARLIERYPLVFTNVAVPAGVDL